MPHVEFHYDYRSPYSYLAFTQLSAFGADVSLHPFDIRDLMQKVENVPTSVVCKPKNRYVRADLARWAQRYDVPFQRHPRVTDIDGRRLLRATLAANEVGEMVTATSAIYSALWATAQPLDTQEDLAAILSDVGLNGEEIAKRADAAENEDALNRATSLAVERGVFGAPTFFVGEEMFFGNDRMDFIRERVGAA